MATFIGEDELKKIIQDGEIIQNADISSAEGLKYDFRLGNSFLKYDFDTPLTFEELKAERAVKLLPGETIFVLTEEYICLPGNIRGRLEQKRKLGLDGIILFGGSAIDPGYEGYLQFGLFNAAGAEFPLERGKKLIGASFERLLEEERPSHKPKAFKGFSADHVRAVKDFKPMNHASVQAKIDALESAMHQDKNEIVTEMNVLVKGFEAKIDGQIVTLGEDVKILKEDVNEIKGKISTVFTAKTIIWALASLIAGGVVTLVVTSLLSS